MAYYPQPTRVWSRVQAKCTYSNISNTPNGSLVLSPLTGKFVSFFQAEIDAQLVAKGNILQYKANSTRFSKREKYSRLARGLTPARTKVFATQSVTYTNPNTTGLKRVGTYSVPFPNQIPGEVNNISGPYDVKVSNPDGCSNNFDVQVGGTLVCGVYENPCTGETRKDTLADQVGVLCFPSSCSDVPGTAALCWRNDIQTYFPRQRRIMPTSGDKWPTNYKSYNSAWTPYPPTLKLITSGYGPVQQIQWVNTTPPCLPVSQYRIYAEGVLYSIVDGTTFSATLTNLYGCPDVYVTAVFRSIDESPPSNVVTPCFCPVSVTLRLISSTFTNANLAWNAAEAATDYQVFMNDVLVGTTTSLTFNFTGSLQCTSNFTVVARNSGCTSGVSNAVTVTINPDPVVLTLVSTTDLTASLSWTTPSTTTTSYQVFQNSTYLATVPYGTNTYTATNLFSTNSFYVTTMYNTCASVPSNTVQSTNQSLPFAITGTGASYTNDGVDYIITFPSDGTLVTYSTALYPMKGTVVGGGGGGSGCLTTSSGGGQGAGGGAEAVEFTSSDLTVGTVYNIVVGLGGNGSSPWDGVNSPSTKCTDGGTTSIVLDTTTYSAVGGSAAGISGTGAGMYGGAGGGQYGNGARASTSTGFAASGSLATLPSPLVGTSRGGGAGGAGNGDSPGSGGGQAYNVNTRTINNYGTGGNTGNIVGTYYGGYPGDRNADHESGYAGGIGGGGGGGVSHAYYSQFGSGGAGGKGICVIRFHYIT